MMGYRVSEGRSRQLWVSAIFLFVFGDALTLQTRGPLLRSFEAEFGVSESLLGLVSPAGTLGFIVAVLLAGLLAGRIDIRRWMIGGIAFVGVSLLLMSGAPVYWLFLVFLLGQGTAAGVIRGLDRPVLGHLYPQNRGRIFTIHSLAWAVGAVLGPVFVNWTLAVGDWRITYSILGIFFLPIIGMIWVAGLPGEVSAEQALSPAGFTNLLKNPLILGMTIAITLVGATEGVIFTWLPYYASAFISDAQANILLTVFLLAYIPGRVVYTWAVSRFQPLWLSIAVSAALVPLLFIMVSGVTGVTLYVVVFVAGFVNAGLFPLISTFGVEVAPEYSGPVSALGMAGAYLGLAVGPVIVGIVAEAMGIEIAIQLVILMGAGILVSLLATIIISQ